MPEGSIGQLFAAAELRGVPSDCRINGADPVLHTRYRVGELGAAAQAAIGTAAAELWQLRTGRRQQVEVDLRHAAISLRGNRYFRFNGQILREHNSVHGFFRTGDERWIFLHCNFPNLRDRALRVLDVPAEHAAVARACQAWGAPALEDEIFTAGGCAGWVRTPQEWQAHPQAAVGTPLLEIVRIGDAPALPLPRGERPLAGIRVLDLTRVIAGPVCTRTLAEHGADVLKVNCPDLPNYGLRELDGGLGKLSTWLDLGRPAEADTLRRLAREGDIFVQSYRPGTLARRGFSPEALAAEKPGIIYVTLSAWGHDGPWGGRRGFDTLLQAITGMAENPIGDGCPALLPGSAMDYISGYVLAFGTMVALPRRARDGGSWLVRASLLGTGEWIRGHGRLDPTALAHLPAEPRQDEVATLLDDMVVPDGEITFLKPVVHLSETPPFYARPPVRLGSNSPVWPARE
jgi:crotonobetainyl-CoA:carnitine CoA-transferase CaiB-like acyl-CoA transferase